MDYIKKKITSGEEGQESENLRTNQVQEKSQTVNQPAVGEVGQL